MEYFTYPQSKPVWFSFENPTGGRNNGGLDNFGAKGHPFELLKDGEEKILCDTDGPGVIRRIWLTLDDRSEQTLRHTRLRMYWENEKTPAVDVPVGDFFCMGHGKMRVFENALFSSPEGRSFHCTVSMPFLRHARITITNQSGKDNKHIFYEINMTKEPLPDNILYFHTIHTITEKNELGTEVPILPKTDGIGRFLGTSIAHRIKDAYV